MSSQIGRVAKHHHRRRFGVAAGMIAVAVYAAIVLASGITADGVLGQFDFTHSTPNLVDAKGLSAPDAVAIDASATPNRVYVADLANNRVLGWRNAESFSNGAAADLVIGQPDFISSKCRATGASSLCGPSGVAVDGAGNLYVADEINSRVLEYANPFAACSNTFPCVGGPATKVFGQSGSFTSNACDSDTSDGTSSANDLCDPTGVAVDASGNLYVADGINNRVLEYNTPLTTDVVADRVFGQGGDFTSNICNFDTVDGSSTNIDMCAPAGVAVDSAGNVYVADDLNNRVLEYNTPLTTDVTADGVYGQSGDFTANNCDSDTFDGSSTNLDMCNPLGVAVDPSGNLYVVDQGNGRVLEYNTPLTNAAANAVFGQGGDFTSSVPCNFDNLTISETDGSSADDLCNPVGVAVDGSSNLWVADESNNRVLEYNTPLTTDTTADMVLGQDTFAHNVANMVDAQGLNFPLAVAIDTSATPNRVYVTDEDNNRVLGWRDAGSFSNGAPADLVIGQPDFLSSACNRGNSGPDSNTLCSPEGVAVDGSGNLYVADQANSRVLEYANPFAACAGAFPCVGGAANIVLGQGGSFTASFCNFDTGGNPSNANGSSAIDLCFPSGVAVDGSGNLYVADGSNSRVLEYSAPVINNETAAQVFGQGGSFTSNVCNFDGSGLPTLRPPSAIDLCIPSNVAVDGAGNLYVVDGLNNHRVLEYNTPLNASSGESGAGDTTADNVFGQAGSFTSKKCNGGGTSADSVCVPTAVAADASGNIYIADGSDHRVLEYNTPLTTDTTADRVYGTCGSFTSFVCGGLSENSLSKPTGIAIDQLGNLYVADFGNSRVLKYGQPLLVLPTPTPTATPTATATATATPTATPTPVPGKLSISTTSLNFGIVKVGKHRGPLNVTVSNKSTHGISVLMQGLSGVSASFTTTNGCNGALPAGQKCKIGITFSPTAPGTQKATMVILNNAQMVPLSVKLKGKGK